ncbi:hypothetical protein EBN03_01150 [Nocardia stercoris]|uniref:Uncharacterized protein n=1 Tax=Nocardia stercoris TaxID=2483361 RepID=A0A3M2LD14_9NOCA|nr:hypothetical protein EBN03_01150 [Nocardia stercoris]
MQESTRGVRPPVPHGLVPLILGSTAAGHHRATLIPAAAGGRPGALGAVVRTHMRKRPLTGVEGCRSA